MSMISAPRFEVIPTPADFRRYAAKVWRLVEAQNRISTNRLAANVEDQSLLEQLIDDVKPVMPVAARGLHYLLATPFRYGYAKASRFRRAGERPGIFYASEHVATAVSETAYWRLLFFSRSPGFVPPTTVVEHSAFTVPIAVDLALNLSAPPLNAEADRWTDPTDYGACQALAAHARVIGAQAIRYDSVRDPEHRANLALLDPSGFSASAPTIEQTWHFRFEAGELAAFAPFPSKDHYRFDYALFGLTAP